mgnify:CR=1 FL=1
MMIRPFVLWTVSLVLLALSPVLSAEPGFEAMSGLTPGEQYRRLGLMRLAGQGVEPELLAYLAETLSTEDLDDEATAFDPDDYTTPLARIVGQDDMRSGAAALFMFTDENEAAMSAQMAALAAAHPVLIEMVNRRDISEDAILVRMAMADAIADGLPDTLQPGLQAYRSRTLYLRNQLEFGDFDAELGRLTDAAIAQVGGRTEAWQRMFEDETRTDTFDHHIQAAESVYTHEPIDIKRANELVDELIDDVIELEGTGNPDP